MSLAAIRELGDAGFSVSAAEAKGLEPLGFHSRHVKRAFMLDADSEERCAHSVEEACRTLPADADGPPVIFPVGSFTLRSLSRYKDLFEGKAHLLVPDEETLKFANDKESVGALAERLGIPVPQSFGESLEQALKKAFYPAVVKYRNGEALGLPAPQRYRVVEDSEALYTEYLRMSALQDRPVVQKYIRGGGFGVSCVFDRQSRPVSVICHRRVREYPVEGGPSACCESDWDDALAGHAVRLLQALKWQGIAMVEFRGQGGAWALMEINPRIWGSFPLTRAVKSGFAQAYCYAASGRVLPVYESPAYPLGRRMNYLLSDGAAALSFFKKGNLKNGFGAVSDILNPFVRDGVLEWGDARASAAYLGAALRKKRKTEV
jgi:predicted ATP-grasp superfamily ATP-dependent carboligase